MQAWNASVIQEHLSAGFTTENKVDSNVANASNIVSPGIWVIMLKLLISLVLAMLTLCKSSDAHRKSPLCPSLRRSAMIDLYSNAALPPDVRKVFAFAPLGARCL